MWTETVIATRRLDAPALVAGQGKPLVCLHGFPDHPRTFEPLAAELVPRGWRVIAPFGRGYHEQTRTGEAYYDAATLVADAAALCAAISPNGPVPVVGHDWGATVVYGLASAFPEHLAAGVAMAVPPPESMATILSDPAQLQRSFYIWFFQLDDLPELVLGSGPELIDFLWRTWSPGLTAVPHRDAVHQVFADPDTVTAALGYYRALFDERYRDPELDDLRAHMSRGPAPPVLLLGGADDGCLDARFIAQAADALPDWCRTEVLDGCGHFLHLERPAAVAARIDDWLRR